MAYDYREAVKDDVLEYINNEIQFRGFRHPRGVRGAS